MSEFINSERTKYRSTDNCTENKDEEQQPRRKYQHKGDNKEGVSHKPIGKYMKRDQVQIEGKGIPEGELDNDTARLKDKAVPDEKQGDPSLKEQKKSTSENQLNRNTAAPKETTEELEAKLKASHLKKYTKFELIRKSLQFSGRNWRLGLYNHLNGMLSKAFSFYLPSFNGKIIDAITKQRDYNLLLRQFKLYLLFLFVKLILTLIKQVIGQLFVTKANEGYKSLVLENIAQKDVEFFDLFKTGELIQRVKDNEGALDNNFISKTIKLLQNVFQFLLMAYWLLAISKSLTLTYVIVFLLKFCTDYIVTKYSKNLNHRERFKVMDSYNSYLNEFIANIRTIKSFCTEDREVKRMKQIRKRIRPDYLSLWTLFLKVVEFTNSAGEIFITFTAGSKAIAGEMSYGDLVAFQQYARELRGSFKSIQTTFNDYWKMFAAWERFFEIYDYEAKVVSSKQAEPEKFEGKVEANEVSFAYPLVSSVKVLNKLSFAIAPGQVIAIVGHSGSGKSTITNLLQRFYDANEGSILFDGVDIKDFSIPWLRRKIGFVSQEPVLSSGTIEENITYGTSGYSQEELEKVSRLANIHTFVNDKVLFPQGYQTLVGERGAKVSGGQKQRIAIARAIMKNSQILIFDEATSALDAESENEVQKAIDNIVKERRITTIIIAHKLCTIKQANLILFLNRGQIIEKGTHEELMDLNGEYKKLIQRQIV